MPITKPLPFSFLKASSLSQKGEAREDQSFSLRRRWYGVWTFLIPRRGWVNHPRFCGNALPWE